MKSAWMLALVLLAMVGCTGGHGSDRHQPETLATLDRPPPLFSPAAPPDAPRDLPRIYRDTYSSQRALLTAPATPAAVVRGLRRIDAQTRQALLPWRTRHPHPTASQIDAAIVALSTLRTYLALETPAH